MIMLGALVYISLDVAFNVISWTSKKTVEGIGVVYCYLLQPKLEKENQKAILPPSYENTLEIIEKEKKNENIEIILKQINQQKKMLIDLENSITNLNDV